jgi:hypothetical protein
MKKSFSTPIARAEEANYYQPERPWLHFLIWALPQEESEPNHSKYKTEAYAGNRARRRASFPGKSDSPPKDSCTCREAYHYEHDAADNIHRSMPPLFRWGVQGKTGNQSSRESSRFPIANNHRP